jgi:hypothetical protein
MGVNQLKCKGFGQTLTKKTPESRDFWKQARDGRPIVTILFAVIVTRADAPPSGARYAYVQ